MSDTQTKEQQPATAPAPVDNGKRRKWLGLTAAVVAVCAIGYGAYWALVLRHYESTDNAYVQGNMVQVTPQIAGTVISINADDTDKVTAGQPLVELDGADARVALDQAEAQLAQVVRQVRTLFVGNGSLSATVALREADVARTAADVAKAEDDLRRRASLTSTGAVSGEEIKHAEAALQSARSTLTAAKASVIAAREELTSNQSYTDNTSINQHPNVQAASAKVREAYLTLKRSELPSPVSGYVARRSVQVGQRVQAGAPLMAIAPLDQLWVDANFKEVQLRNIRIGQPVKLTADVYGGKIEYDGTVAGLGAGTGAAFALLPAQNATGNWIKVVQRVPVRIALDPKQLQAHPLRIGLSMEAEVDIANQDGKSLAEGPRAASVVQTQVFDVALTEADSRIARIIADNAGATHVATLGPAANGRSSAGNAGSEPIPANATLARGKPNALRVTQTLSASRN
ncbi:MAG TPA: efflux RND transporter periplasmic adaptor subunit [Burkholderiales bacterium]|jgi:membrane fusion protein (multidrug efflux system)|nr:efflux RND transporter periplasmic adaptor subunit [Burkholderiales bacterium]